MRPAKYLKRGQRNTANEANKVSQMRPGKYLKQGQRSTSNEARTLLQMRPGITSSDARRIPHMKPGSTSNDVRKYFFPTRYTSLLTANLNVTSSYEPCCHLTTVIKILSSDDIKCFNVPSAKRISKQYSRA